MALISLVIRTVSSLSATLRLKRNPVGYAKALGVTVGPNCDFISLRQDTFGSEPYLIKIGAHVTLSGPVRFITHDGAVRVIRNSLPDIDVIAPITIGNNVFIGPNTIILPGVNIGNNSVVGAGSIVTRDIPAETVVAGNPAKPLKSIAAYRTKVESLGLPTKRLTPDQKREFLTTHFRLPVNS